MGKYLKLIELPSKFIPFLKAISASNFEVKKLKLGCFVCKINNLRLLANHHKIIKNTILKATIILGFDLFVCLGKSSPSIL